jgi:hypothetical protein
MLITSNSHMYIVQPSPVATSALCRRSFEAKGWTANVEALAGRRAR